MANRPLIYSTENGRSFDFLWGQRDWLEALCQAVADELGETAGYLAGLGGTQTSTPSLTINIAAGSVYQETTEDPNGYGSLPASAAQIFAQGVYAGGTLTFSLSALAAGQSQWALVEAQFQFVDVIRTGDPSSGVLPYFNTADPGVPLQGPGGSGTVQNTERQGALVLQIKYGSPATTGSEVPPNPDSGWLPLYLVDLTYGQTGITTAEILTAGPSVGTNVPSNYPYAPLLAGLLNSHHDGNPGQAPKIKLSGAAEVQGTLPIGNLVATSGGTEGALSGVLPVLYVAAGAPSSQPGALNDLYFDKTNNNLYICTVASPSAATWTVIGGTAQAIAGDVTGTLKASTVVKIQGNAVENIAPTAGQFMVEDAGAVGWKPASISGDASASTATPGKLTITGIQGVPVALNPANGQIMDVQNNVWTPRGPFFTNVQEFDSTGSFTVPAGVYLVRVRAWGGGGGGAGSTTAAGGPGGGGGGYAEQFFAVAPNDTLDITIGTGGAGGAAATNGSPGTNTTVEHTSDTQTLTANGGIGGDGSGGAGGGYTLAGGGTGGGGFGFYGSPGNASSTTASGSNTSGGAGGAPGLGGGAGSGVVSAAGNNAAANSGAGGAGGGTVANTTTYAGGNGGSGRVILEW